MTTLTFQNTTLSVISKNNQTWLSTTEISKALGYNRSDNLLKLYNAHADEFTPCMTALIDMQTAGGVQKVRIFSLRGCHLIGMLSHTKVAKEFRRWVLDILDREVSQNPQKMLPLAQADLVQIVQAVQQAMPQPKEIYQARNLHEVLPLAFLYNKIAVLAEDFLHLYKFLHQKGHGTMAEICKNHFNALNADTALMNRASCCIQRLTLDLSDEDQDTVRRLCLG